MFNYKPIQTTQNTTSILQVSENITDTQIMKPETWAINTSHKTANILILSTDTHCKNIRGERLDTASGIHLSLRKVHCLSSCYSLSFMCFPLQQAESLSPYCKCLKFANFIAVGGFFAADTFRNIKQVKATVLLRPLTNPIPSVYVKAERNPKKLASKILAVSTSDR